MCISKKSKSQLHKENIISSSLRDEIKEMKIQVLLSKVLQCPQLQLYTNSKYMSRKFKKSFEKSPQTESSERISWSL